ncbi:MAG TPA: hypothetical protein VMH32_11255 [Burkholderiales bacterium]|nr:hypothetical protein [Burkholderiales bacterium]
MQGCVEATLRAGLRFSNVMETWEYEHFPAFEKNPAGRKFNFLGYLDPRDSALAIRRALSSSLMGAHAFVIASEDSVMTRPTKQLLQGFFPQVSYMSGKHANASLLSIERARRVFGFAPRYTWHRV